LPLRGAFSVRLSSIQAAVSIAHKDGLSYDEHDLVVPFNCTIDRVKVRPPPTETRHVVALWY
jgi:hypothetical protein